MGDDMQYEDFEVIDKSEPMDDYLLTNKFITLCKVEITTLQHPVTKVVRVERRILSISHKKHRDRSKYMPHQGKQEMERRVRQHG